MIACAYLRIFRPLDQVPEPERSGLERSLAGDEQVVPLRPVYRQVLTAERGRLGILTVEGERTEVRSIDDRLYVCPSRTRLRVLAGLLSLRETVPPEMADALVPETEARRAARELARIRRHDPAAVPTMLQSAWHVPVRWFVLVDEEGRRLVERPAGGYRLFYWAPLPEARGRAARALEVLRRSDLGLVADLVQDMAAWLEVFDDSSLVELDYADVSSLFSWNELDEDHSALEVQGALHALAEGDLARAGEFYQSVAGRWAEVRVRESLN